MTQKVTKNPMAAPHLVKIIVNIGVKQATMDKKNIEIVSGVLTQITGQKPKITVARKSIAGFKLREGDKIGLVVTIRGKRMHDFLDRLLHIVLPRSRDFRGIDPKIFDKLGNCTIGIEEHTFFPEISPEKVKVNFGLEITVKTTAKNKEEGLALLKFAGFPIK